METMNLVCRGASIARYGDGEIVLSEGHSIRPQRADAVLAQRLRGILSGAEAGKCLVGIPNLRASLPQKKMHFWTKYLRAAAYLTPGYPYVSGFISRPDSAPWLNTPAYWDKLESLWKGQDVTLVRGDDPNGTGAVSLRAEDLTSARRVTEVIAPGVNAWASYADILARIGTPKRALICLGATATVMAVDLCAKGIHAIDLGHIGMFLAWHRDGSLAARLKRPMVAKR
jgi:hypothetical protein